MVFRWTGIDWERNDARIVTWEVEFEVGDWEGVGDAIRAMYLGLDGSEG